MLSGQCTGREDGNPAYTVFNLWLGDIQCVRVGSPRIPPVGCVFEYVRRLYND